MVRHEAPILYDFDPRLAKRFRCLFIADSGLHPHVPWTSPQYFGHVHRHIAASAEQLDHIHRFIELIKGVESGDAENLVEVGVYRDNIKPVVKQVARNPAGIPLLAHANDRDPPRVGNDLVKRIAFWEFYHVGWASPPDGLDRGASSARCCQRRIGFRAAVASSSLLTGE
jgi:hypothetical protein